MNSRLLASVSARWSKIKRPARSVAVVLALAAAIWMLLRQFADHYPVQQWLFWRYLDYWLLCIGFSLACTSGGFGVLKLVGPRHLPLRERLLFSMATGVLLFFFGMFVGGLFGLYGTVFAIAWPILLLASGAYPFFKYSKRAFPLLRGARRRAHRLSNTTMIALALGFVGVVMVYLNILTPDNISYDSRWYHLALPEHYAAQHGLFRSPEGWFHTALPQLACLIYTWPYLFERFLPFDQLLLAAHLEFVLFLWTLLAIGPLVRWLVPGARTTAAWAAMFLFSGIFCYDSTLNGGSDHIAAFWALPAYLALRRAYRRFDTRSCILLGAMLAGALNTKVQAIAIVVFPCIAIALRAVWFLGRDLVARIRQRPLATDTHKLAWLIGPAVVVLTLLLLTTPYWLKNWIWHGDPFYPALYKHLKLRPWHEDMNQFYATLVDRHFWRPEGTPMQKWKETFEALYTFSFKPHDWPFMHGDWPVFGFLFTLSWFVMPFIGAGRRGWSLFIAGHVAVLVWYRFSHQDRYLVCAVPLMAAHVAAVTVRVWKLGLIPRVPMLSLIGLQAIWGGAAYWIPSHVRAAGGRPSRELFDLFSTGYRKAIKDRLQVWGDFGDAGRSTPPKSKILLHRFEQHAGLARAVVMDHPSWQGLIDYGRMKSDQSVYDLFHKLGVTHVMWENTETHSEDSLAGDLRFFGFVTHVLPQPAQFGGLYLSPMPDAPPSTHFRETVLYLGCSGYTPGIYELSDLTAPGLSPPPSTVYPQPRKPLPQSRKDLVDTLAGEANYVVHNPKCPNPFGAPTSLGGQFVLRSHRFDEQLYVRSAPLEE